MSLHVCNIDVMMMYVVQAQSAIGSKVRQKAKIRNQVLKLDWKQEFNP